jgi:hypothetical protein
MDVKWITFQIFIRENSSFFCFSDLPCTKCHVRKRKSLHFVTCTLSSLNSLREGCRKGGLKGGPVTLSVVTCGGAEVQPDFLVEQNDEEGVRGRSRDPVYTDL